MKINRWKLEHGSLQERIEQAYAISKDDILCDSSIIDVLRCNLESPDNELLEISIMRLGIRAKDISSAEKIIDILRKNEQMLVRSAAIAALSSLYRDALKSDKDRADKIMNAVRDVRLDDKELEQVENEFVK